MSTGSRVLLKLPEGEIVHLDDADARFLVEALWEASSTRGAVVAIGRIAHRLGREGATELEVSELETNAIGAALRHIETLSPSLTTLREAVG